MTYGHRSAGPVRTGVAINNLGRRRIAIPIKALATGCTAIPPANCAKSEISDERMSQVPGPDRRFHSGTSASDQSEESHRGHNDLGGVPTLPLGYSLVNFEGFAVPPVVWGAGGPRTVLTAAADLAVGGGGRPVDGGRVAGFACPACDERLRSLGACFSPGGGVWGEPDLSALRSLAGGCRFSPVG